MYYKVVLVYQWSENVYHNDVAFHDAREEYTVAARNKWEALGVAIANCPRRHDAEMSVDPSKCSIESVPLDIKK